jgi:YrbI family 3-deoxy-D-manno-octulosonate 8-phosphate phosphatase
MNFFKSNLAYLQNKGPVQDAGISTDELTQLVAAILSGERESSLEDMVLLSKGYGLSLDRLIFKDLSYLDTFSFKDIKMLVLDVDGVMTDGGMYYGEGGDEFKKFHTRDGVAVRRLTKKGFQVGIISSGFNVNLINKRADLLGIQQVYAGEEPKLEILTQWISSMDIEMSQVAFIGDDLNDKALMENVGFSACPANAEEPIKQTANLVLSKNGGEGCIREFVDNYLAHV